MAAVVPGVVWLFIFESGIRISIKRLSFVPRLAEHGSDTCKTIWSDSRIHERFDF